MNPGELRNLIKIKKLESVQTENNFEEEAWVDYKGVWAKIENLYGREFWAAKAVQAEKTVKFIIRYCKDIDESMKIEFQGELYNIIFIDDIKYRHAYMEIKAVRDPVVGR